MKKILPLLVACIFVLSGFGVVAVSEEEESLNKQDGELDIEIKGGFGVKVILTNMGTMPTENTNTTIMISGAFIFMGGLTLCISDDPWQNTDPGESVTIKSNFVLGFGFASIHVKVNYTIDMDEYNVTKDARGFVFGPFVLNVKEV